MQNIKILLDSTCDMSDKLMKRFDLDYVRMGVTIDDVTYPASLTWESFTSTEYYEIIKKKRVYTNQITEPEFLELFNKLVDEGNDVLYIACSSGLSGSVKEAAKAAAKVMEEKPGSKIIAIDSLISGMGQGILGIHASDLRAEGKSIDEIAQIIEGEKLTMNQWGTVNDLNYLKRAGRVTATSAFFGNLFAVKPILISDAKGHNVAAKKVNTRKKSLDEIAQSLIRTIKEGGEGRYIAITHADCPEDAAYVKKIIDDAGVNYEECFICPLGPILSASCGPQTVVTYNFGPEVTYVGE